MQNSRYYPFERNRYFYGKLLTVRDFEAEQNYVMDKRRLMNRLLFGSGIITGLKVDKIDFHTISIQSGAALDNLGREIIVPAPITTRLSLIDGFAQNDSNRELYLCLAYSERGREPVHTLERNNESIGDLSEHNRVQEVYQLILKENPAEFEQYGTMQLKEQRVNFYQDERVKMFMKGPKYAQAGIPFDLHIYVVKTNVEAQVILDCKLEMDGVQLQSGSDRLTYNDSGNTTRKEYRIDSQFIARQNGNQAIIRIVDATIRVDGQAISIREEIKFPIDVIEQPDQKIWQDYSERSLEDALDDRPTMICLAKISLIRSRSTYSIDQVDPVPFGDYVRNTSDLYRLGLLAGMSESEDQSVVQASTTPLPTFEPDAPAIEPYADEDEISLLLQQQPTSEQNTQQVRSGMIELSLSGSKTHNVLFSKGENAVSEEIEHGLGAGSVYLTVGLWEEEAGKIFAGNQDVFDHTPYESSLPQVKLGTVQYPEKGTFRIGAKVFVPSGPATLRIQWWAVKAVEV